VASLLLQQALSGGGVPAVIDLARRHRGPIVEPAGDPETRAVTFVFQDRTGVAERVCLSCPALPEGFDLLCPLGSAAFAGTYRIDAAARVKYRFFPNPPAGAGRSTMRALAWEPSAARVDYFNPRLDVMTVPELGLRVFESVLSMPDARPTPWSERRPDVPNGSVSELTVRSDVLRNDRPVSVYRPPGHDAASGPLPLVVLLDGHHGWWRTSDLFDNLLADGAAAPFLGVTVGGRGLTQRPRELAGNPLFVRFVAHELLPLLASRYALPAGDHVVAGFSLGAVGAAYLALQEPRRFSRLIAVSGGFHLTARTRLFGRAAPASAPPWLVEEYERSAGPLPRRVYLAAGSYEARREADLLGQSTRLAGALRERGVDVRLDGGPTDHDTISARAYLAEGIAWMLGPPR